MEGIRRIGIVIKALAMIWLLGFAWLAVDAAIGADVPLTDQQKADVYERQTGKHLDVESLKHPPVQPREYDAFDKFLAGDLRQGGNDQVSTGELLARADERQHILDGYFSNHPATMRVRQWGDFQAYAIAGVVGAVIIGAIGWIVAGFAVKRQAL
ncbi:hypothetical protein [Paraburkholderia caffeinilytica]|uniref:hypothetical protein n=1 Tax=Paraburkholderia caffeinilytica TaxID=1761016 RepID=UPI003D9FF3BC